MIKLTCPICRQRHPHHKMDCPNRAFVEQEVERLREALEKMTADRDEWQEASELWREDSNHYMTKWLNRQ